MKSTSQPNPESKPESKAKSKAKSKAEPKPLTQRSAPKKRALEILARLKSLYPEAPCSLDYSNPFQLMVATILAAQCTDERVNKVTPALFARYPDIESFAGADLMELESYVRSTGFFRNKAKNIRAASQRILEVYGGDVPRSMAELITLGGVARKTANVVLAHGFGIHEGVTVDTHVKRLTGRLGLTAYSDPIRVERDLMALLPQPDWENWSIRLVYHGRAVCDARKPACDRCVLMDLCPGSSR
jgi:endonuclease III